MELTKQPTVHTAKRSRPLAKVVTPSSVHRELIISVLKTLGDICFCNSLQSLFGCERAIYRVYVELYCKLIQSTSPPTSTRESQSERVLRWKTTNRMKISTI